MKYLVLIAGAPGSGKSTLARHIKSLNPSEVHHVEADMFFERDGAYAFNPTQLPQAHAWCRESAEGAMREGVSTVIVANTFRTQRERTPYLELAKAYQYTVVFMHLTGVYTSVHDVPAVVVEHHRNNFESFVPL